MANGCKFCGLVIVETVDYHQHLVNEHPELAYPEGIPPALEHLVVKKKPLHPNLTPDGSPQPHENAPGDREGAYSGMDVDRRMARAPGRAAEEGEEPTAELEPDTE